MQQQGAAWSASATARSTSQNHWFGTELNELRGPTLHRGKLKLLKTAFSFYFVLLVNDRRTIRSVGGYAGGSEKNQEIDQP